MQDKYEGLKLENQLCFPLYACSRLVIKKYHPVLSELDLTYTQYIAMLVFWEVRSLSVKELGRRLFLDSGTLTPLLKSMEAKGLIRRFRSSEDERVLIAEITDEGMALREKAADIPEKVGGCIKLEAQEAAELYRLLYKLLEE
ncbi:MAG: MarR family transcriptional regulator [Ruminococcus sp.]|nr:MarR family transcriptional regulator [Ruminococcus sp.]